jgi:hypothetical protein
MLHHGWMRTQSWDGRSAAVAAGVLGALSVATAILAAVVADSPVGLTVPPTTTSTSDPLDCPDGRFETAQADFYGQEPMEPYHGAETAEIALQEYVREPIVSYSRVAERDPAYKYFRPDPDQVVFLRTERDGRRTMSVLVRPSSAGGWQGEAHIACGNPTAGG